MVNYLQSEAAARQPPAFVTEERLNRALRRHGLRVMRNANGCRGLHLTRSVGPGQIVALQAGRTASLRAGAAAKARAACWHCLVAIPERAVCRRRLRVAVVAARNP